MTPVLASEASEMAAIAFDLAKASIAPAIIAFGCLFICRSFSGRENASRFTSIAIAVAFMAGYAIWFGGNWSAVVPAHNWPSGNWTFYLAPLAAIVGLTVSSNFLRGIWRFVVVLVVSLLAAWLLVPTWDTLWPPRPSCIPLLAAYFVALTLLLDRLANQISPAVFLTALTAGAAVLSLVVTAMSSMRNGEKLAITAAAFAGCTAAALVRKPAAGARGIGLIYAILVGGWAFVAGAYPQPPHYGYLLVPAAPLILWGWAILRRRSKPVAC
jgi:hypothetical protein